MHINYIANVKTPFIKGKTTAIVHENWTFEQFVQTTSPTIQYV